MKAKNKTCGTFYGIGVGPGDPELIPVKAVRLLNQKIDRIFTAASTHNPYSLAVEIAKPYIPPEILVEKMDYPMSRDKGVKKKAWRQNAHRVVEVLKSGENAAFLTLGDPLTYSTYGYTIQHLKEIFPQISIVTVPGITSYQAAAARLNTPLVEGHESLTVLSGVAQTKGGTAVIPADADNIVFLKAYRDLESIYASLENAGLAQSSVGIINCGREDEAVYHDIRQLLDQPPNYWTLIIAKRKKRHESPQN